MPPFKANKVRLCRCGCGQPTPLAYDATGRFKGYADGLPGHLRTKANTRMRDRRCQILARLAEARIKPLGTTRLQQCDGLTYRVVKTRPLGKWPYEHRVVAERILGRPLHTGEHVHHLNHNTLDNRPENLQVLSAADHGRAHRLTTWAIRYTACQACGTTARPHEGHGLCDRCHRRVRPRASRAKRSA